MLFWEDTITLLVCLKYYYFMSILNFCLESYGSEYSCHIKEELLREICWVAFHFRNSVFIIYLLEDEQELSVGMLIRLRRIYNFWLFHAIILSTLDVLYAFICYFIWFLGQTYLPRAQCQFLFFPWVRVSQKRKIKWSPIDLKLHGTYFWKESNPGDLESTSSEIRGSHEVGGAPSTLVPPWNDRRAQ